jgi:hypothetical protein
MLCGSISTRHGTPNFTVRILSNWQSPKNDVPFGHFQTKNSWKSWVESLVCFAFDVQMCTHESGSACVPTLFDFCRDGRFTGHVSALVQAEGKRGLISTIWLVIAWIYSFRLDLIEKLLPWFFAGKVIIVFQLVRETDQLKNSLDTWKTLIIKLLVILFYTSFSGCWMIWYFHSTFVIIKSSRKRRIVLTSFVRWLATSVANVFRHRVHLSRSLWPAAAAAQYRWWMQKLNESYTK